MISALLLLALQAPAPVAPLLPAPLAVYRAEGENQEQQAAPVPRLTRIRRDLGGTLYSTRPWLAHERGWTEAKGLRLGFTGAEAALVWTTLLETTIREIERVLGDEEDPVLRAEHESLLGWLQAEYTLTTLRESDRHDPVRYVEHVDRTLRAVIASDTLIHPDKVFEVSWILADLPAFWDRARQSLSAPAEDWALEAVVQTTELINWLPDLEKLLQITKLPPKQQGVFEAGLQRAIHSTIGFQGWLLTSSRSGELIPPLQEGKWGEMAQSLTGTSLEPSGIRLMLLDDLKDLAHGLGPVEASTKAPAKVLSTQIAGSAVQASSRAMKFAAGEGNLISHLVGRTTLLKARLLRGNTIPGRAVNLRTGRFDPRTGRTTYWLDLEAGGVWSAAVQETRQRLFTKAGIQAIGIRYGFPGEMLMRYHADTAADPIRGRICNRALMEGWGLYTIDWLPRVTWPTNKPYAADAELQQAFEYLLRLEAARLLAAMELHHEGRPEDEVIDAFARRTGFDELSASLEISRALHDPLHGIGYLAYHEMRVNEALLAEGHDDRRALVENVRAILHYPHLRPADLRENRIFPYVASVAEDADEEEK